MKYAIIANGPFLPKDILREVATNPEYTLIALDGAADKLAKYGIMPNIISGDFDSIQEKEFWGDPDKFQEAAGATTEIKIHTNENGINIVYTPDQDATDLSKAIKLSDHPPIDGFEAATEIHIFCALDGRPDHSISNLGSLKAHAKPDRPIYIHTEAYTLQYVENTKLKITPPSKGKYQCAIMGAPEAAYLSKGLQWDGTATEDGADSGPNGYKVFTGHDSTSNLFNENGEMATITITGAAFIMQPGILKSQLRYLQGTEDRQLQISKFQEQIDLLNRVLVKMKKNELDKLNKLRKLVKQKLGIKQYTADELEQSPKHQSRTHCLSNPSAKNNQYYFLSIPRDKLARLKELEKQTAESVSAMSNEEIKRTFPNFGC